MHDHNNGEPMAQDAGQGHGDGEMCGCGVPKTACTNPNCMDAAAAPAGQEGEDEGGMEV